MLNFCLLAALALGALGIVSMLRATPIKSPTEPPVKLIPKHATADPAAPKLGPVDAFRAWFTVVRPVLLASGASPEEIRQAGLDLVKHMIMEAPSDEG